MENTENQGAARIKAERPGRATISLKVRVGTNALPPYHQTLSNAVLTDKLEIKVSRCFWGGVGLVEEGHSWDQKGWWCCRVSIKHIALLFIL